MDRTKAPHPIDIAVGRRIRLRRQMLGLSQGTVGERLGISFQAVQKYETGRIRVSASRLVALAEVLEVPVTYFFEALPHGPDGGAEIDRATAELFRLVQQLPADLRTALVACLRSTLNYYRR